MRILAIAALCVALAGCAFDTMRTGLDQLVGQPISAAISKLGIPDGQQSIAGQNVYVWNSSTFDEGTQLQCKIKIATTHPGDIISRYDFDGNIGMCSRYAARLRS